MTQERAACSSMSIFRPAEVELLLGDASKAERELGWTRKVEFPALIRMMVQADREKYGD